ncbi:protein-glutamate O-methyltransferase CheR [Rhodothermus sp. AH-315-K08]|nr:protein-glutamate O-methyltransferase CheR [Rhodothermus sp. AH-315-K08]
MAIPERDYDYFCELVHRHSGIVVGKGKTYLLEARLSPIVRDEGMETLSDLAAKLRLSTRTELHTTVIEAMTTNETSFFRDTDPFDAMRDHLIPKVMEERTKERSINIWCAACATGQEPYTIAMTLREHFPELATWRVNILATDLAHKIINYAKAGTYNGIEIKRGLSERLRDKYFRQEGEYWQINQDLRQMINFRQMNLIDAWPLIPQMDVVFLRNVLIYFNLPQKQHILIKLRKVLKPGGSLFLGKAETTYLIDTSFKRVPIGKAVTYQPQAEKHKAPALSFIAPAA